MNPHESIEKNLELLEPFAIELADFFAANRSANLFKRNPVREEAIIADQRLQKGSYLFTPCGIDIDKNESNRLSIELLELLKKHLKERESEFISFSNLLINEQIDVNEILTCTLKNEADEIRKSIGQFNLSEDLITFFLVYLARPFREQAAAYLLENISILKWHYGYCLVCGHWSSLGHIHSETGARTLWCLCCGTKWNFKRTQCVFCLNEDHLLIENLHPENEESFRIQACKKCKRYLKEIRNSLSPNNILFDKIYLGTLLLDLIGEQKGYLHESILPVRYNYQEGNELLMYRQKEITMQIS